MSGDDNLEEDYLIWSLLQLPRPSALLCEWSYHLSVATGKVTRVTTGALLSLFPTAYLNTASLQLLSCSLICSQIESFQAFCVFVFLAGFGTWREEPMIKISVQSFINTQSGLLWTKCVFSFLGTTRKSVGQETNTCPYSTLHPTPTLPVLEYGCILSGLFNIWLSPPPVRMHTPASPFRGWEVARVWSLAVMILHSSDSG